MFFKFKFNKTAIFYEEGVLLRKKGQEIRIRIEDIDYIEYNKPTLFNFITTMMIGDLPPNLMAIHLKNKVGNTTIYLVKIKRKETSALPDFYRDKMGLF